jgi:LmbE family N-acetylglucosaminyl deacetylase
LIVYVEEENMTKTLLAVLAHPDDESFGLGGTLAFYASKGYDVYYVCATRGEAGTVDEEHLKGFKDTAERSFFSGISRFWHARHGCKSTPRCAGQRSD